MREPQMRAADTDRAAVASQLGEHMAAGRLSLAEYDERLTRAYAARTYGELAELTADLPSSRDLDGASPRPPDGQQIGAAVGWGSWAGGTRAAWASWLGTAVLVLTIWLATSLAAGELLYPWPVWVIGPWGAVLLFHSLTGGRKEHGQRTRRS